MSVTSTRLPLVLSLLAALAMAATLSWQGYGFWQSEQQAKVQSTTARQVTEPVQQAPTINLATIDLFGTANQSATPAAIDTENLPETNLRLFLRGVLAAEGDFPGSALIEDDKRDTQAYLVGDELPGNAKLRSVHPNRVIIERSGKLENLYFPELEDQSGMDIAGNDTTEQEVPPSSEAGSEASAVGTPVTPAADEKRREEVRRRLEQLRERLRSNGN